MRIAKGQTYCLGTVKYRITKIRNGFMYFRDPSNFGNHGKVRLDCLNPKRIK